MLDSASLDVLTFRTSSEKRFTSGTRSSKTDWPGRPAPVPSAAFLPDTYCVTLFRNAKTNAASLACSDINPPFQFFLSDFEKVLAQLHWPILSPPTQSLTPAANSQEISSQLDLLVTQLLALQTSYPSVWPVCTVFLIWLSCLRLTSCLHHVINLLYFLWL